MAFKAPAKTTAPIKHVPPHSLEAEAAVLGSILINPDSMNKVVEILEAEHFYSPQNKLIYEAAFTLYNQNKPIDGLSLTEYFRSRNKLDDIGGVEYLGELGLDTVLSSNIEYYADIIKENALKRRLVNAGSIIIEEVFKNPEAEVSLEIAEKTIFEIAQQKSSQDVQLITNLLMETVEQLEFRYNNKGTFTGVPSGYYDLDTMLAGFQKSDLIILAARPSMGKTAFALNIAQNIGIEQKIPVLIFSLEMSAAQLTQRILCSEAEIDAQRARTGELNANEWEKIDKTYTSLYRKVELDGLMNYVVGKASEELMNNFLSSMANNFNTSLAITTLYDLMKTINKDLRNKATLQETLIEELKAFNDMLEILGLVPSVKPLTEEEKTLVLAWQMARNNKDFEQADKLRAQITEKGIVL